MDQIVVTNFLVPSAGAGYIATPALRSTSMRFSTGYVPIEGCDAATKSYVDNSLVSVTNLYNQVTPVTIADHTDPLIPNLAVSLLGTGVGAKTIPAPLTVGRAVNFKNRTLLSTRNGKESVMAIILGDSSTSNTITYSNNVTNVYAEIDLDILCTSVSDGHAAILVQGRTLFGTGPSGSGVAMRYLSASLPSVDRLAPLPIDITFQWGNASRNAGNTLTSQMSHLDMCF